MGSLNRLLIVLLGGMLMLLPNGPAAALEQDSVTLQSMSAGRQQRRYAFHPAFTARAQLVDPQNNYYDNTRFWFDSLTGKQLVEIDIINPNPLETHVLLRYDLQVGYQFDNKGANCFSFNLASDLSQFFFSDEVERLGRRKYGSTRTLVLREELENGHSSIFNVVPQPTTDPGVRLVTPLDVVTLDGDLMVNHQIWWNFRPFTSPLPDQSVFEVPSSCPEPAESSTRSTPRGGARTSTPATLWSYLDYLPESIRKR